MSLNITDVNGVTREFAISSDAKQISLPGGIEVSAKEFEAVVAWFRHGGHFGQPNRPRITSVIFFRNGNVAAFSDERQVPDEKTVAWEIVLVEMVRRGVVTESTVVTLPCGEKETTVGKLVADGQLSLSPQEREYLTTRTALAHDR